MLFNNIDIKIANIRWVWGILSGFVMNLLSVILLCDLIKSAVYVDFLSDCGRGLEKIGDMSCSFKARRKKNFRAPLISSARCQPDSRRCGFLKRPCTVRTACFFALVRRCVKPSLVYMHQAAPWRGAACVLKINRRRGELGALALFYIFYCRRQFFPAGIVFFEAFFDLFEFNH